jgi:hypothetical protein
MNSIQNIAIPKIGQTLTDTIDGSTAHVIEQVATNGYLAILVFPNDGGLPRAYDMHPATVLARFNWEGKDKLKVESINKICSCGAKHTSNPKFHLSYCDFGKKNV